MHLNLMHQSVEKEVEGRVQSSSLSGVNVVDGVVSTDNELMSLFVHVVNDLSLSSVLTLVDVFFDLATF